MAALLLLVLSTSLAVAAPIRTNCSAAAIPTPSLFGAEIQSLTAAPVSNYSTFVVQNGASPSFNTNYTGLDFCNVTVTYTHPGWGDTIDVNIWLPSRNWNGRFQGAGGGGWITGYGARGLAPAVALGYAAASTDGGHSDESDPASSPEYWGLSSPGNPNLPLLQDFASTALNDMAVIGKAVTRSYYGRPAEKSYWVGCSTGGRQGLMLAQRYPDSFDGIIALSPAINWDRLPLSTYLSQQVMNQLDYHVPNCELESITALAIKNCDLLDGVKDQVIANPDLCDFNATWAVGQPAAACKGTHQTISSQAAQVVNAIWAGPRSLTGEQLYPGLSRDAPLIGVANTTCTGATADSCKSNPYFIGPTWLQYFVAKNADFDYTNMTYEEYASLFQASVNQYASVIGTRDPDLSQFRARGGKMITTHGTADYVIPHKATEEYYLSVLERDPNAADFFRFFEAPGDSHCGFGMGNHANNTLEALVKWVEHGKAPETLTAVKQVGDGTEVPEGERTVRRLCAWPKLQRYVGGDPNDEGSFECA